MDYIVPGEMELMSAVIIFIFSFQPISSSSPSNYYSIFNIKGSSYLFIHKQSLILVDAHIDKKVRSVSCNSSMSKCNKTEDDEEYSKVIKMKMKMVMVVVMVMMMMMMMVMMMVITTSRSTQKNAMTNMKISTI